MEKVKVISTVSHRVGVKVPDIRFSRQWPSKGSSVQIDKDTLEELMYDSGFRYMIESGMLYIEDMVVKKELGLEPEDATAPVNIIVLTDTEKRTYLTTMPFKTFQEKAKKLGIEQLNALAEFAIKNKLMDYDKCKYLKEACGKDIIQTIKLKAQNEEE